MNTVYTSTAQVGTTPIHFETGKLARLADGSITVSCGETKVLVTAVSSVAVKEGQDWFPLSVEYKEKAFGAGTFPGGYFKREGRPTEKEILTSRMIDRPLRPLFPKGYYYETQIIATMLSTDSVNDADILAINGSSAALVCSDIPFAEAIGAVRVGRINNEFIANPTFEQRQESQLDLVYVGNKTDVIMIEGEANELPEQLFIEALHFAQSQVVSLIAAQEELAQQCQVQKRSYDVITVNSDLLEVAYEVAGSKIEHAIYAPSKNERANKVAALKQEVAQAILERFPDASEFEINQAFVYLEKKAFRIAILDNEKRADGRGIDEIRPLLIEEGILPRVHGSALFSRGETQSLAVTTLASTDDKLRFDNYSGGESEKTFILHYDFPPFSVNECGRVGSTSRREIGHGALAERSVKPIIPDIKDFPYAIRTCSEILESNGSSSMATVCSATLSLLSAGVPIKKPVAGISVGLVTEMDEQNNIKRHLTLLDILGTEDFYGDMDFKLCGTSDGVTGFQLDLKLPGIALSILEEAIHKAYQGRLFVMDKMQQVISTPKALSPNSPKIESITIPVDKIGVLIGPSGKTIKNIQAESGAKINIDDDGTVHIYANNTSSLDSAKNYITGLFAEAEAGKNYEGKVISTTKFGAFVEILPGKEGLVHISELAHHRVENTEDIVQVGQIINVKCIEVDNRGRIKLTLKNA